MTPRGYLRGVRQDGARWFRAMRRTLRTHRIQAVVFWSLVLVATLLLSSMDLLVAYEPRPRDASFYIAKLLRRFGDFRDTLFYAVALLAGGYVLRRRTWRTIAVAVFLSACISGITTNLFRFTTGRPRPRIEERTGWVGPTIRYKYQSFPSGHTGTSVGMSTALLLLYPPLGVPAFAGSCGIAWASIHNRNHFPTDIFFGGAIGIFWGVLSAGAARDVMVGRGIGIRRWQGLLRPPPVASPDPSERWEGAIRRPGALSVRE